MGTLLEIDCKLQFKIKYTPINKLKVGFDNERSIALKVKWAASIGLGGSQLLSNYNLKGDFI